MTIQTKNLILAPHLPRHLRALLHGPKEFENVAGLRVADGIHHQLLSTSSDFKTSVEMPGKQIPGDSVSVLSTRSITF
ncbi:MAG: hypothetical protein DME73_05820 [Verrucomicrobia bacterium]|nr:MAG: hypothetical protein DME73_05820 [Verrucomicrobiota bacterium]